MAPSAPRRFLLRTGLLVVALFAVPAPAWAAWPNNPVVNVPLCTASNDQISAAAAPDGAGGAIVAWCDLRSGNADIYVQRLSATGIAQWAANGVALCTATGSQLTPRIVPDGAGGAVVVWEDQRGGNRDIYAQRVNEAGAVQWTADGVAVSVAANDQKEYAVISDGAGGAIVAWSDYRSGTNYDIYAQRVNASGALQWLGTGIPVCTTTAHQFTPTLAPGGAGGAIITWWDLRGSSADIYALRLSASGSALWPSDGLAICAATGSQQYPVVVADGLGGAVLVWEDQRSGSLDVYAQRVSANGAAQWTTDGVALCTAAGNQGSLAAVSDGAGGAIVAWSDYRLVPSVYCDLYARRVNGAGTPLWAADGLALCTAPWDQAYHTVVSDGLGGAIFAWFDQRMDVLTSDIYAQHVDAAGVAQWNGDGLALSTAAGYQITPTLVSDGAGGAIAAWHDRRTGYYDDIYAQKVDRWGYLGAQPTIAGVRDVPADEGGVVKISWYASPLDSFPAYSIAEYLVYRSVPPNVAAQALRDGAVLATGMDADRPAGRRLILARPQGAATLFWEYVSTVTARRLPGYSCLAPTACDSVSDGNPKTLFMVEARTADGAKWWFSDPDSGYSVDNLAPATPAPFTGVFAAGATALHWGASAARDFAEYRLYRDSAPDFVPGPANLLVAQADTGCVDVAGAPYYYKLCAVDIHGNVSPYATLLPAGTVDVPGVGVPHELALSTPAPNPLHGSCSMRLALPRSARVSFAVFDQQGRRLRTLLAGEQPAGEHAVTWDGLDDGGRAVASGVYFVRCTVEGRTFTRRIAALR
jgi:hypothetical protein